MKKVLLSLFLLFLLLVTPGNTLAVTYYFSLDSMDVHVFINENGTYSIDYLFVFSNDPSASPIDFVDVGLPNSNFDVNKISAEVNGQSITDISKSDYQGSGVGVALALRGDAIQPGETGQVHVYIDGVDRVVHPDSQDDNYASAVFGTTFFGSQFVTGTTDTSVTFHLPPGVQPEEPRWHSAPDGFPVEPETGIDEQGRVTYTWRNPQALGYEQYEFGASFPGQYIPAESVVRTSIWGILGTFTEALFSNVICCGGIAFALLGIFAAYRSAQKRKLHYLPPKIAIEGHGIKRGLTAVEAAILLEQPMDKIMTMILFSTIKKGAATVIEREPLEIDVSDPLPEGLHAYETNFLNAMQEKRSAARRKDLQEAMIDLINSVSKKMKGFSRRETVDYYRDITKRAWAQVEAAETPEVKSEKFDENMDWTMLDEDYEDRTRDVFRTGPVFIPMWWPRYDPGYRGSVTSASPKPVSTTSHSPTGTGMSLPQLPGSAFAASVVTGVQNFSSDVIGNVTNFTNGVTQKTNPVPVSKSGGGGGRSGGGCACACACAGCACACAGGGR